MTFVIMNILTFTIFDLHSTFKKSKQRQRDAFSYKIFRFHLFSFLLRSSYMSIDIHMHENGLNIPIYETSNTHQPNPYCLPQWYSVVIAVLVMVMSDSLSFFQPQHAPRHFVSSLSSYGSLSIQLSWFCRSFSLAHCFFTV